MAKAQVRRTRITIEVDPVVQQKIAQWSPSLKPFTPRPERACRSANGCKGSRRQ